MVGRLLLTALLTGFVSLLVYRRSYFIPSVFLLLFSFWLLCVCRRELLQDPAVRLLGIFTLSVSVPLLLAVPTAIDPEKTALMAVMCVALWLVGSAAIWLVRRFSLILWVQYALFGVLLFWCLDGLWQAVYGVDLFGVPRSQRLGGFFTQPNKFGWYIGMLSGLLLLPTLSWLRIGWAQLPLFLLVIAVVILGNTRASWIVCCLVLTIWTVWRLRTVQQDWRKNKRYAGLMLLPLITVGSVYALDASFSSRLESTLPTHWTFEAINTAFGQRPLLWQFALQHITETPFWGHGVNAFEFLSREAVQSGSPRLLFQPHAHQMVLDIWLVSGPLGLICLLYAVIRLFRAWFSASDARQRLALPLLATVFLIWFPLNTHRDFFASEAMHITWWLLALGLAALMPGVRGDAENITENGKQGVM
ncbi:O-antigen ligase family protein [Pseudomaricurvus sp.]|uniref:O-antigen ligase family protein n=1 Tax=Pseudomaricurvus sp. TaxID=2004510 RepID=UPI003F6B9A61